jgi:hypothetical protein
MAARSIRGKEEGRTVMATSVESLGDALLLAPATRVTCPKCEHEFSLEEGFAKKSLEAIEAASAGALERLQGEARSMEERRARERAAKQEAMQQQQLKDMKSLLEAQIASQAKELEVFRNTELQLRKERAELEARQAQFELDVQRKLDAERRQIADSVRQAESEKSRLREADLQKKLDDMRTQVEEMKRKAEQGSQQSQGEVLELLLEEQIAKAFPLDVIEEVKKGARGGDIVHRVLTRSEQQAGLILWEAKRAQNWSPAWPGKLKDDMREVGADLGVIVATSLPKEFEGGQQFGPHEDVWVTTPGMALQVAGLLRALVENVYRQRLIAVNRDEKADAVYDYLTGPAFAQKWKKIYDVFEGMKRELDTERTVTTQRWARRERQMQQAVLTLAGVAGDIQGLAQQELPQLELVPVALEGPEQDAEQGEE